jgi:hypothetical protein
MYQIVHVRFLMHYISPYCVDVVVDSIDNSHQVLASEDELIILHASVSLHTQNTLQLLMLFWKLIDENKRLLAYVLRVGDVNDLAVPMLYFMYEGRKDASKIGPKWRMHILSCQTCMWPACSSSCVAASFA